jgi:hypothetical protein
VGVDDLIATAKGNTLHLPPAAMADMRKVLASNDAEPNARLRVSSEQFRGYLEKVHNARMGKDQITKLCKQLGRGGWTK